MTTTPAATNGPTPAVASNLTAPPSEASKLVQPEGKKKVKIRALKAICINELTLAPGSIAEVDEEVAEEFCDRKFEGGYAFAGERGESTSERHVIVRAERVNPKTH